MRLKPSVDLKVLYYFTVLAHEEHFGNAAKIIGIEQPPLSLQIKKLERIIGGELFDRSKKQIKLTPLGKTLLPEATMLIEKSNLLIENIRNVSRGDAGILNIGFATSTSFCGIPSIIQKHKKLYPKVELRLKELSSAAQITELQNGTIDFGFIREIEKVDGIISKEFILEKFIAVLSKQHHFSKVDTLRLKDLEEEPFVLFPRHVAPRLYDKVNQLFSQAKFYPNIIQEASEWQTIVSLVEANLGVSVCPESFQKLKIGQVQYKPLTDIKVKTGISVCYSATNNSKLIPAFLNLVEELKIT
jgi:DNA-binding transcriptional LysR family regulator